ncbi:MAG: hypothetical protein ABSG46_17300 [Candidatus Binataceae bacterium]|jgi:hypothetical protein
MNDSKIVDKNAKLLIVREFEAAYREAASKSDKIWENTIADGLADEAW